MSALSKVVEVNGLAPAYVKAYVKRDKTDAADAEAICEAVTRPTMRFVPVKSRDQQAALFLHRTRDLMVKQRTQLVNMLRAQLAAFGIDIQEGLDRALTLARRVLDETADLDLPKHGAMMLAILCHQALGSHEQIRKIERELLLLHRTDDVARRLATIPGIGPIGATAFAAWLGLTPLQNSSGGKERLGRISKMGDKYLRRLLVIGATFLLRQYKNKPEKAPAHVASLLARKPMRVVTVAMANKTARIIWALMTRKATYRTAHVPALAG